MVRRSRVLLALAALVVVLTGTIVVAWSPLIRLAVLGGLRSASGRDVTAAHIRLDLFRGHFSLADLRLADRQSKETLATIQDLDVRFRVLPVLGGKIVLEHVTVTRPSIALVRARSGRLNVSDLIERYSKPSTGEPADVVIDRVTITDGTVAFKDFAIEAKPTLRMSGLAVEVRDLATRGSEPRGTVSARFSLNGAPTTLEASKIALRPVRAHATLTLDELDLVPVWAYVPETTAVRPGHGRFSTRLIVDYSADGGVRAGGDAKIADLRLLRRGQAEPLVATPVLTMTSRDVVYRGGVVTAGRLELAGDAAVTETSTGSPNRFDVSGIRLVVENAGHPSKKPATVSFVATLPSGGALRVGGNLVIHPPAAELDVSLTGLDTALALPYLPRDAYVTIRGGKLDSTVKLRYASDGVLNASGDAKLAGLTLQRRDQAQPFVTDPVLSARVDDFEWREGATTVGSVRVSGTPTVVDATAKPPARFDFSSMAMMARNVTWPSRGPANIRIDATEAASTFALRGSVDPGTLAAEARARFRGVDLRRAAPYLPTDAPVAILRGMLEGFVKLAHDRATGVRLSGDSVVTDLAVAWRGEREPFFVEPRLAMRVTDAVVKGPAVSVARAVATGTPKIIDARVSPARQVEVGSVRLQVDQLTAPSGGPARVQIDAAPAGGGSLAVRGTVSPATRTMELAIEAKDVGVAPYAVFIPIDAAIAGRVGTKMSVSGSFGDAVRVIARGDLTGEGLTLGPGTAPPLTIGGFAISGLDLRWPERVTIARVSLTKPYALIERDRDGTFPLRAMLTPRTTTPPNPATPAATTNAANTTSTDAARTTNTTSAQRSPATTDRPGLAVDVGEIAVQDGDARFIDHGTTPAFSEEITGLALNIRGLRTTEDSRADLTVQAVVGARGALQLKGQIAPLGKPFYLDVEGDLRDLAIPSANPYMRHYAGWIAESGSLTTKLHYRVVGDELTGANEVVVQRIKVERAPAAADASAAQRVGLPLGMIVAVITDSSGTIRFNVPVTGKLSAPGFSFGDAIWTAVKNALVNVAAAPFRAIGRLFRSSHDDGAVEQFRVDPIRFQPGSATLDAEGEKQLQRVADFLRASPFVNLVIEPAVSATDITTLKTQAVAAAIQRTQRERQLPDFAAAATALFKTTFPDRAAPKSVDEIVAALRDRQTMPDDEARSLEARRLTATLKALVDDAGIEAQRLRAAKTSKPLGGPGDGRIEFELAQ